MNLFSLTVLVWLGSLGAGFVGALTGLGGGVIIIPMLTLLFGVDIRYAIGASLVSVIATSSGAASGYVKEGYTNLRIAMFLEIATTAGAVLSASLASRLAPSIVAVIFGAVLIASAWGSRLPHPRGAAAEPPDRLAGLLRLDGSYPGPDGPVVYQVRRVPAGFGLMFLAGALSGLLGIGSGAVKVLALDQAMRLPFKVSTTTSNFMIGVTAAASAGVYLNRGYLDPGLAMPVMLGVLPGALLGARFLARAETRLLRAVFALVILLLGIEMIYNGLVGNL
jgi:uncharacterized membrane protein YfcA